MLTSPLIRRLQRRKILVVNLARPNAEQGPASNKKLHSYHQQRSRSSLQRRDRHVTSTQHCHRNPPNRDSHVTSTQQQRTQVCHHQRRPTRDSRADHKGNERSQHGYSTTKNIMTHSDKDNQCTYSDTQRSGGDVATSLKFESTRQKRGCVITQPFTTRYQTLL